MPEAKQATYSGTELRKLFVRAHRLTGWDAILTALLGFAAVALLVIKVSKLERWGWAIVLSLIALAVIYLGLRPYPTLTACLVSARKRFLDGQITTAECEQQRKACLKKSLLY